TGRPAVPGSRFTEGSPVMGYSHYWSVPLAHPDYATAWPGIIDDTRRVIDVVRATGVVIAGPHGYRRPVLNVGGGLAFNGAATTDLAWEAFLLRPRVPADRARTVGVCKTGRKPYDLAVPCCCDAGCCCPTCSGSAATAHGSGNGPAAPSAVPRPAVVARGGWW